MKTKTISLFLLALNLLFSLKINAQDQLQNNLILHYKFEGAIRDLSGKKKTPKINDDPKKLLYAWVQGRDGKPNSALLFRGNSEGLKPGLNISPASLPEFTFTAWVLGRPSGFLLGSTLPQNEASKISSRSLYFNGKGVSAGYMAYSKRDKINYASYLSSSKIPDDEWNFVALSVSAKDSTMRLYADGEFYEVRKNDIPVKVFCTNKGGQLIIGNSDKQASPSKFAGRVDEIRIYNKALTPQELSSISGIQFQDAWIRIARNDFIERMLILALILFYVLSVIFMIVTFFREKKYKAVSDKEFDGFVADSKNSPDISATNELAQKYLDDAFNTWTPKLMTVEDGYRTPTKRKHFKTTFEALKKARELKPSERHIIDRMNELGGIYNNLSKRRFYGNKVLIVAALILPIVFLIIEWDNMIQTNVNGLIVMVLPTLAYVLSNFAPTYVVANRTGKVNRLFGGIFAAILGAGSTVLATEYYNQITWSNGSKTVEYDTSSNLLSLILGILILIAALILSMFLVGLSAIISFFRNYIFYI